MINELEQLAGCGRGWAEDRAKYALTVVNALNEGAISEDEFKSLMADLINTDRLEAEADDLEIKNALVSCIMIGAKLA